MKQPINIFFTTLLIFTAMRLFGQADKIKIQVDSLSYLSGDIFDCNSLTWRIIANRKEAIPFLIDKISDTALTEGKDKCKTTHLRVGDIAYLTLKKILPLPFFAVTGMQCDLFQDGCQVGVLEYVEANRTKFKEQVQVYYNNKKDHLKWRQLDSNHLTPCYTKNNITGQYE